MLSKILDDIVATALTIGLRLDGVLNPPAALVEISEATKNLPWRLPQEVTALYEWRNGTWPAGQTSDICLMPTFFLAPLQVATSTWTKIAREPSLSVWWRPYWFPILTDAAGNYFAASIDPKDVEFGRVYRILQAFEPAPAFWNLESMCKAILECFRTGAYFLDEDGFLSEDTSESSRIYRRFNRGLSPHD